MDIRRITKAPANLRQFVEAISPEYGRIYGKTAAAVYRLNGPAQLAATISHPAIRAYATLDGDQARALLFVRPSTDRQLLSFFHVLPGHGGPDDALELLSHMHHDMPADAARAVYTDFIPLGTHDLRPAFDSVGYKHVERTIMKTDCHTRATGDPCDYEVREASIEDIPALAALLFLAYVSHPESHLYEEVRSPEEACLFLSNSMTGFYGPCPPGFALGAWDGTTCIGLAIGSEIVAEMGFVLHMAVHPDYQGRGVGGPLLSALTNGFANHRLTYAALGVTCTNPAVHLYRKSGFDAVHQFPVYYHLDPTKKS